MSGADDQLATFLWALSDDMASSNYAAAHSNLGALNPAADPTRADLLDVLETLGVLVKDTPGGEFRVSSESARYFLRSLSEYVRNNEVAWRGWDRSLPEHPLSDDFPNGPYLTLQMEQGRSRWESPTPTRNTEVVQALVKAEFGWKLADRYLVRWDSGARRFQLVGGHKRSSDSSSEEAMLRELQEEIPGFLTSRSADSISVLSRSTTCQVSRTHGALTEYSMTSFTLNFATKHPELGPDERWVTLRELSRGRTRTGQEINQVGLWQSLDRAEETIKELPSSFSWAIMPPPRLIARQFFVWAAAVSSVLGLVVTVVALLLT